MPETRMGMTRRPANLSLDAALVDEARALGLNLSAAAEAGLRLAVAEAPRPAARLNPVLTVAGEPVVMVTQFLSAVPASLLRGGPVSLSGEAAAIGNALDLLLTGV
jgi:hypothetical protein